VAKTITSYGSEIADFFSYRLTNAASEAFKTKINVSRRRA
jgi:hypothetical protein